MWFEDPEKDSPIIEKWTKEPFEGESPLQSFYNLIWPHDVKAAFQTLNLAVLVRIQVGLPKSRNQKKGFYMTDKKANNLATFLTLLILANVVCLAISLVVGSTFPMKVAIMSFFAESAIFVKVCVASLTLLVGVPFCVFCLLMFSLLVHSIVCLFLSLFFGINVKDFCGSGDEYM